MITLLDVIWIDDETIDPPHPKMVVCVNAKDGWFLRINSRNTIRPCIAIPKEPFHRFLKHDSHIEGNIIELDEYIVDEALRRGGIIGSIHRSLVPSLISMMGARVTLTAGERAVISGGLNALLPKAKG
jgi:hypothetical protein